jgi:hypothetical protein
MPKPENYKDTDITQAEQERIAGCYTKTLDYYGELPYSCKDCCDFTVCFTLDEQNIITTNKGGD